MGKPLANLDEVLKKKGIDQATMFGGTIKGNGARSLMENADAIINKMEEHVLDAPTRFAGTVDEIRHVGESHRKLLHLLDGYSGCLQTKRFHLSLEIAAKVKQFRDQVLLHERHLVMSVTTKSHLMEDHSLEQQEELEEIGILGEDFGEQNHLDQAKADRRLGCIRHFVTRETIKSKEEVQRSRGNGRYATLKEL
jgi:hypothetical protein